MKLTPVQCTKARDIFDHVLRSTVEYWPHGCGGFLPFPIEVGAQREAGVYWLKDSDNPFGLEPRLCPNAALLAGEMQKLWSRPNIVPNGVVLYLTGTVWLGEAGRVKPRKVASGAGYFEFFTSMPFRVTSQAPGYRSKLIWPWESGHCYSIAQAYGNAHEYTLVNAAI